MEEIESELRILLESDLIKKLLLLNESSLEDKNEIAKEFIEGFIGNLPIQYKTLQNRNQIMVDVLREKGVNDTWIAQNLITSKKARDDEER